MLVKRTTVLITSIIHKVCQEAVNLIPHSLVNVFCHHVDLSMFSPSMFRRSYHNIIEARRLSCDFVPDAAACEARVGAFIDTAEAGYYAFGEDQG